MRYSELNAISLSPHREICLPGPPPLSFVPCRVCFQMLLRFILLSEKEDEHPDTQM